MSYQLSGYQLHDVGQRGGLQVVYRLTPDDAGGRGSCSILLSGHAHLLECQRSLRHANVQIQVFVGNGNSRSVGFVTDIGNGQGVGSLWDVFDKCPTLHVRYGILSQRIQLHGTHDDGFLGLRISDANTDVIGRSAFLSHHGTTEKR